MAEQNNKRLLEVKKKMWLLKLQNCNSDRPTN